MRTSEPIEDHAHPRLFWGESELPALRAKADHGAQTPYISADLDRAPLCPRQIGLVVDHGYYLDTIVANPLIRRINLGGIDAKAGLVVVRRDQAGHLLAASAADCFSISVDGRELLPPRGRSEPLFEYRAPGTGERRPHEHSSPRFVG